jgi:uncharacterized phage protein gp47/JayE
MAGALDRIKSRHTTYPTDEGTFLHDAFAPVAEEIDKVLDVDIPEAINRHMVDTATGEDLDRLGTIWGVYRKSATKATGTLTITGASGTAIPSGTLFSTESGTMYATTASATIPSGGSISVAAEAVIAGITGNVGAGTIIRRVTVLSGITSVTNPAAFGGGAALESDTLFRERILERLRNPASSGCERDYIRWAKEVSGVEDARCIPRWDGPGTVKVVLAGAGMTAADPDVVADCFNYIEEERPIGALVTVVSATPVEINIAADVVLQQGFTAAAVAEALDPVLTEWLREQAFAANYISYAHVGKLLLGMNGVLDYDNLTINGASGNLALADDAVPVTGTVTLDG